MTYQIKTSFNKAFEWVRSDNISFIGYLIDNSFLVPTSSDLKNIFSGCKSLVDYELRIKELNGVFSIIIAERDFFLAASDSTRFFPLFYAEINHVFYLSDDIDYVQRQTGSMVFDEDGCLEFLSAAFTCGKRTVYKGVSQIRPAEILTIDNDVVHSGYFYRFSKTPSEIIQEPHGILFKKTRKIIDGSFSKLFNHLKGRSIALPLSGGYDSRLIGLKLKEHGFKDVTCFTFGRKTPEVEISKKVAAVLGYKWHFVEYTDKLIKDYHRSELFHDYYQYASRGTSMFFLQEYPAVKHLVEENILTEDHIVLPGHSGDLIRGAMLYNNFPESCKRDELSNILLSKKFIHASLTKRNKSLLVINLKEQIDELFSDPDMLPYSVLEDWEMKERTSKYIFNSSHVFTFFGMQTFFPLWNKDIVDLFRSLPFRERLNGKLYNDVLKNSYFGPNYLIVKNDNQPDLRDIKINKFKKKLRRILPYYIREKLLEKNDWPFYKPMTRFLLDDLGKNRLILKSNAQSYLYRILNWYLFKTKERISVREKG